MGRRTTTSTCGAGSATRIQRRSSTSSRTEEIGGSSDSYYSNPEYDRLFLEQRAESDPAKRKELLTQIQELVYAEAPYHILYYDAELHAYRKDKFGGWTNQPSEGGTPLFGYGSFGYTKLTDLAAASPEPSASAAAPSGGASPAASPGGGGTPTSGTSDTGFLLVVGIAALALVLAIAAVLMRRRRVAGEEE